MQISVARPGELGPPEIAAWQSMQRKTESLANPFLCPEFAVAVDRVRADARVAVLTDGPDIVGFFPFQRRRLGVGVPIGSGLNDCQGVIHAPDVRWHLGELLRACGLSVWQFDCLVEDQWPFEASTVTVAPSPVIDITDGFETYQENLRAKSPQFCKDLARRTRKLEREAGRAGVRCGLRRRRGTALPDALEIGTVPPHGVDRLLRPTVARRAGR